MKLTSPSFAHEHGIPRQFTCQGKDTAPALAWTDAPSGTQSFALILDDPDAPDPKAPRQTWVHWVVYNIPGNLTGLAEGGHLPDGARPGLNDFKKPSYGGPCPPTGRHRYYFKLYALDTVLADLKQPTKDRLLDAIGGHVLASAQLMGTYQKG